MHSIRLEKQDLINEFFSMVRKLNRTAMDGIYVREFFWKVSEIRDYVPPTVEFLTVLRYYNSVLFYDFRKSLVPNSSMWLLAGVDMDVNLALHNLGVRTVDQLRHLVKGQKSRQREAR
ncbi:hypothetical protein [Paenibacillus hamazuiensis]|uniref:hypothetical protein n=1 Tax=Paenibacillus hamazuiensis TaxID=2936508 RepID=UPI00200C6B88|nr:hypothetical protein [Paenibacillus hamazuiensis]